jgi:hypothetical protein
VKITGLPAQKGFERAVIETVTGSKDPTTTWIWFDMAGFPLIQVALEFSSHVTRSPFTGI